jgi:hypothetical protein
LLDRCGVLVDGEDLVSLAQKIDEVAAGATACIEDAHAGCDVFTEELIEDVDVDGAELLLERGHGDIASYRLDVMGSPSLSET